LTFAEEQTFTDFLVVALLLLLLGPRQEVLAHTTTMNLKAPRTLGNPRDTYYLQVSGQVLKDGPFSGAIPGALTSAMTYYIQRVRPLTVEGPMFVGTNGLARIDFSTSTRRVTMAVLGRPITAHRFRHSQVTDELQRADVTAEVRRDMATHRGHSVQVQEQHYHMQRLERTQGMMQTELLRRAGWAGLEQRGPQ
jgi:integrase